MILITESLIKGPGHVIYICYIQNDYAALITKLYNDIDMRMIQMKYVQRQVL